MTIMLIIALYKDNAIDDAKSVTRILTEKGIALCSLNLQRIRSVPCTITSQRYCHTGAGLSSVYDMEERASKNMKEQLNGDNTVTAF